MAPAQLGHLVAPQREDALVVALVLDGLHEVLVDQVLDSQRALRITVADQADERSDREVESAIGLRTQASLVRGAAEAANGFDIDALLGELVRELQG